MTVVFGRLAGKGLTRREREVLRFAARGLANEEIAARLYLSPDTVRTHMRRVIAKLGARGRAHAVALSLARDVRPALAFFPACRLHPQVAPLPDACPDCRRWVDARRVLAEVDVLLGGGA